MANRRISSPLLGQAIDVIDRQDAERTTGRLAGAMRVDRVGRSVVLSGKENQRLRLEDARAAIVNGKGRESLVSALRQSAIGESAASRVAESNAIFPASHFAQLRNARDILRAESEAIREVSQRLETTFCEAVDALVSVSGRVVVTGMGKAGLIGQKLAATLSSTGTPAFALHPAEAVHGDLGCVCAGDVVLCLSNSGETEEVCRLLETLRRSGATLIAMTSARGSTLGRAADVVLEIGRLREADSHGLAPSTSTTAMLALGDALALVASRVRGFTPEQFAVFHPGGSLGRKLACVSDVMRPAETLRIAKSTETVRSVFVTLAQPGRRSGAVLLIDGDGCLVGLFTDSDLARLLERRRDDAIDEPIHNVMTVDPACVGPETSLQDAVDILSEHKLSELPVVDDGGKPLGLLDITDVIGVSPVHEADSDRQCETDHAG